MSVLILIAVRYPKARASQVALVVENPLANAEDVRDVGSILGWEDPLEEGMATHSNVFLPGESHGRRSLVGYRVESDTLKTLSTAHTSENQPGIYLRT